MQPSGLCELLPCTGLECLFASHCAEAKEMEVIKLKQEAFLVVALKSGSQLKFNTSRGRNNNLLDVSLDCDSQW